MHTSFYRLIFLTKLVHYAIRSLQSTSLHYACIFLPEIKFRLEELIRQQPRRSLPTLFISALF